MVDELQVVFEFEVSLKCPCDEKMLSLFSLVSDFIFGKSAPCPGGEGGYPKKFYTGRLRPEVQPLTLLYTIFSEKAPLSYTFYPKKAPLSYTFYE